MLIAQDSVLYINEKMFANNLFLFLFLFLEKSELVFAFLNITSHNKTPYFYYLLTYFKRFEYPN